eukprot:Gregarina_sp_Pseudo_9__5574@NODE_74_length_4574_cov_25_621830_g68_i0_p5_GENE_NODE_74_length_4574_cov_25_621830_g68_i0NODE_74_length_4574_cov_25_621830_g68_i0_p5_ORF_typecomplete_len142_score10_24_NODE_74_length_4574_cov_25_621830_g68_i040314456
MGFKFLPICVAVAFLLCQAFACDFFSTYVVASLPLLNQTTEIPFTIDANDVQKPEISYRVTSFLGTDITAIWLKASTAPCSTDVESSVVMVSDPKALEDYATHMFVTLLGEIHRFEWNEEKGTLSLFYDRLTLESVTLRVV